MFTRITESGGRRYLQIVESFRNEAGKPRLRVVANLGRVDGMKDGQLDALIRGLSRAAGRVEPEKAEITYEAARSYGDVFALHELWKDLGFDHALGRALRSGKRKVDVEALVRAMVFNRLCDPTSKLGCLRWLETVAMPAMPDTVTHQHLLRAMDALMDHAERVEMELARQIRPLVDRDLAVVFYDLTTVRIHGDGEVDDDLRAYGMNKETGGIARQFVLGVVQTADGLPLMHTVHPGNVGETKTLQGMLQTVLQRFPVQRVILVADRGLLSLENIDELTALADQDDRKLEFILAVPARRYADLVETFRGLAFDEGGLAESNFAGHRLIVAHDPVRAADQSERRRARIAELEAQAEKMVAKLDAQDDGQTARGRRASDRGAYSRFTRAVAEAELTRFLKADLQADRFSYSIDEDAVARAELFDGKLALLTNAPDLTPTATVTRYKSLADIERGFRVLKSDIEIAPVHHRLPDRIRAHALICFLALVLYRVMRMRLKAKGHDASPRTALDMLARIHRHEARIADRKLDGLTTPTPEQLDLFDTLNLPKPA
ncbi:Mobile element protein (plasmid) [Rhodovulum sp. P5]|uniref:IS1634 family transposase n=1 Tax=Rhodovulum sp. P5 TaxID=1564506 RepID=UPI0009C26535|nr:IS1634 family transposase [Rhodovulum sp. P5]ARE39804.1 Mobile element protein [Rhodovulum sp. P5]ARE39954.1 Mobile element protein [Rhodovulum sp. P5]ARE40668.1 Mobile element protein [Rhodovulum sp. P5]ARE40669.1 Mobile element protein [Rhodovulum sp. P5]ARE40868.1 Mobile element protein [Rhodovulum sp. P5]